MVKTHKALKTREQDKKHVRFSITLRSIAQRGRRRASAVSIQTPPNRPRNNKRQHNCIYCCFHAFHCRRVDPNTSYCCHSWSSESIRYFVLDIVPAMFVAVAFVVVPTRCVEFARHLVSVVVVLVSLEPVLGVAVDVLPWLVVRRD